MKSQRWMAYFVGALAAGLISGCASTRDDSTSLSGADQGDETGEDESTTTGVNPGGCQSDDDCVASQEGGFCDLEFGVCWPECAPGTSRSCYSGPAASEGVGACQAGTQECSGMGVFEVWCEGEVVPGTEDCDDNQVDDDCDGLVDDTDLDGDGFGACSGSDCCDVSGGGCSDAELVNPGAYEYVGNDLDDDCDGEIDEVEELCDTGIDSDASQAIEYARAMDLCVVTDQNPPDPADRTWGVIEASLSLANGSGSPVPVQHAIRGTFGDIIDAERGDAMALLSSGHAAGANDTDPDHAAFQAGVDLGTEAPAPEDWLDANGGSFPNPAGCIEPWDTDANDSVMLTFKIRAPTNAKSFSVRTQFFSAEYPEWVCSEFNDFFVALVDSEADNPEDTNIAIYDDGDTVWPVGVNLVMVAEGLFTQCENGTVGCSTDTTSNYSGCLGTAQLDGTGFDAPDNGCGGGQSQVGGGTGWLTMSGNVEPGEVFEISFAVWDTSGHIFDSLVLLDQWEWSIDAAIPGVAPG